MRCTALSGPSMTMISSADCMILSESSVFVTIWIPVFLHSLSSTRYGTGLLIESPSFICMCCLTGGKGTGVDIFISREVPQLRFDLSENMQK